MADVDKMSTWPKTAQFHFVAGTGPARHIRGQYSVLPFGRSMKFHNDHARAYWAGVVGDKARAGGNSPTDFR